MKQYNLLKDVYSIEIVWLHGSKKEDFEAIQSLHQFKYVYKNGVVSLHHSKMEDFEAIQLLQ